MASGAWSVRLASTINDEPAAQLWDTAGQLVLVRLPHVRAPGADGRAAVEPPFGDAVLAIFARHRGCGVVVQAELETFAIEADGTVAWRIAHSDVVTEAAMVGGRLVLTGYGGGVNAWTPRRVARQADAADRRRDVWIERGQAPGAGRSSWTCAIDRATAGPKVVPSPEGPSDTNG